MHRNQHELTLLTRSLTFGFHEKSFLGKLNDYLRKWLYDAISYLCMYALNFGL
jgi:hypothetical protein